MRIRTPAHITTAIVAILTASGCASHSSGEPGATRPALTPTAAVAQTPTPATPDPSDITTSEPIPAEVEALPGVGHGLVESALTLYGFPEGQGLSGRILQLSTKPELDAKATLALCQKLTEMGYGPGGTHGFVQLAVSGSARIGTYVSWPSRPACTLWTPSSMPTQN
ncbi:hypothetical protein ACFXI0_34815 [Kitasatospora indigofera]|uniref:hypothetical protein n=1 Tax=Kitasatospora indigofera TaxID=67307 RepID=UPI0036AF0797